MCANRYPTFPASYQWKRSEIRAFITMLQCHPCLWDVKCSDYKDKKAKSAAIQDMLHKMKFINVTITSEDIRRKIFTLRSQFRREVRLRRQSVERAGPKSAVFYKPTLWCYKDLYFLQGESDFLDDSAATQDIKYHTRVRDSLPSGHPSSSHLAGREVPSLSFALLHTPARSTGNLDPLQHSFKRAGVEKDARNEHDDCEFDFGDVYAFNGGQERQKEKTKEDTSVGQEDCDCAFNISDVRALNREQEHQKEDASVGQEDCNCVFNIGDVHFLNGGQEHQQERCHGGERKRTDEDCRAFGNMVTAELGDLESTQRMLAKKLINEALFNASLGRLVPSSVVQVLPQSVACDKGGQYN